MELIKWITTETKHKESEHDALIRKNPEMTIAIKPNSGDQHNRETAKNEYIRKKKIQAKHKEVLIITNRYPSRDLSRAINKNHTTLESTKIRWNQYKQPANQGQKQTKGRKCWRGIPKGHLASDRAPMHPVQTERFHRARQALSHFGPSAKGQSPPATHQRI